MTRKSQNQYVTAKVSSSRVPKPRITGHHFQLQFCEWEACCNALQRQLVLKGCTSSCFGRQSGLAHNYGIHQKTRMKNIQIVLVVVCAVLAVGIYWLSRPLPNFEDAWKYRLFSLAYVNGKRLVSHFTFYWPNPSSARLIPPMPSSEVALGKLSLIVKVFYVNVACTKQGR